MLPILYSFRRCPYAMRARLAIALSGQQVELREVVLRDKPKELLEASPKGTVPVLIDLHGQVIDQSLDIMLWAFSQTDKDGFWMGLSEQQKKDSLALVGECDDVFKPLLDRYKYFERYTDKSQIDYREEAVIVLKQWDDRLSKHQYLMSERPTIVDIAIFPFVRQFAHVDKNWFDDCPLIFLKQWLEHWLSSTLFLSIMQQYPQWPSALLTADSEDKKVSPAPVIFP